MKAEEIFYADCNRCGTRTIPVVNDDYHGDNEPICIKCWMADDLAEWEVNHVGYGKCNDCEGILPVSNPLTGITIKGRPVLTCIACWMESSANNYWEPMMDRWAR